MFSIANLSSSSFSWGSQISIPALIISLSLKTSLHSLISSLYFFKFKKPLLFIPSLTEKCSVKQISFMPFLIAASQTDCTVSLLSKELFFSLYDTNFSTLIV